LEVVVVSVSGGESKFLCLSPDALSIVEEAAFQSGVCGITGSCLEVGEEYLWCKLKLTLLTSGLE